MEKSAGMTAFEEKISSGLVSAGLPPESVCLEHPLGLAVSGGADSISLLLALLSLFDAALIRVITVNHNIREENETAGDACFVMDLCSRLNVSCTLVTIPRGKVFLEAEKGGQGIEAAARALRYQAFSDFISQENLSALCLAHNQNDLLETILMRFLQGSGSEGGGGILRRRNHFVRPMLDVSREEIEAYLHECGQDWRTDSTNADTAYLRNKVRHNLIPFLDGHFEGWKKALLYGAEKARDDNDALQALSDRIVWERDEKGLFMDAASFYGQEKALRRRLLYQACNLLPCQGRLPYSLVRRVCAWNGDEQEKKGLSLSAGGVEISLNSEKIYVKKCQNKATESGFLDIIKEDSNSVLLRRSLQSGDVIRAKDGSMKPVQKIFTDWKVSAEDKNRIPLIQDLSREGQPVIAILGSEFGYSDWIVK